MVYILFFIVLWQWHKIGEIHKDVRSIRSFMPNTADTSYIIQQLGVIKKKLGIPPPK